MKARSSRIASIPIALSVILSMLLAACQIATPEVPPAPSTEPPAPTQPPTPAPALEVSALQNVQWAPAAYGDPANPSVPPRDIKITALFDPQGNLSGFAGWGKGFWSGVTLHTTEQVSH